MTLIMSIGLLFELVRLFIIYTGFIGGPVGVLYASPIIIVTMIALAGGALKTRWAAFAFIITVLLPFATIVYRNQANFSDEIVPNWAIILIGVVGLLIAKQSYLALRSLAIKVNEKTST